MKRIIIALLVSGITISLITGCGGHSKSTESNSTEAMQDTGKADNEKETENEQPEANADDNSEKSASNNPLMNAVVEVDDVLNGTGDAKLGERASVTISGSDFEALTPEQLYEFANEVVDGSGYNWFTVRTDGNDGNIGLQFNGCMIQLVSQGVLDEQGRVVEEQGTWKIADGSYEFIGDE